MFKYSFTTIIVFSARMGLMMEEALALTYWDPQQHQQDQQIQLVINFRYAQYPLHHHLNYYILIGWLPGILMLYLGYKVYGRIFIIFDIFQ